MPAVPDGSGAGGNPLARKGLNPNDLNPNDLNPEEMDRIIMRLFKEVRRQLSQLEGVKDSTGVTSQDRDRNARTLAQLERTMERLTKLEAERSAARKSKAMKYDGNARQALRDQIARIIRIEIEGRGS